MAGGSLEALPLKRLGQILLGSWLVFMAMAMVEEREVFLAPWFAPTETASASDEDRTAAEATVQEFLSMVRHAHLTGGDPRFLERVAAAPPIVEEIAADIQYLSRNGRRQDMTLQKLDLVGVQMLGPDQLEVRTREYWTTRFRFIGDGRESDPTNVAVASVKYRLSRAVTGWMIEAWDLDEAAG